MFVDKNGEIFHGIILLADLLCFSMVLKAVSDMSFIQPFQIAMKELRERKIPFTIRRYLPDGR
jgi:hypothetical protein